METSKWKMTKLVWRLFPILLIFFFLFGVPLIGLAASVAPSQLVPDCNVWNSATFKLDKPCGWAHLVQLANNLLKFMVYLAVPIAAIAFAWAGVLYLSARGNPGQISKAHGIFLNVAFGLVIVLIAWLVVDQIVKFLADPNSYISVLR